MRRSGLRQQMLNLFVLACPTLVACIFWTGLRWVLCFVLVVIFEVEFSWRTRTEWDPVSLLCLRLCIWSVRLSLLQTGDRRPNPNHPHHPHSSLRGVDDLAYADASDHM